MTGRLGKLAPTDPQAATDLRQYLVGQKPTSSGCLPPEQARVVLHRLRRAKNVFEHLLEQAEGADEELGYDKFAAFCDTVGLTAPNDVDATTTNDAG